MITNINSYKQRTLNKQLQDWQRARQLKKQFPWMRNEDIAQRVKMTWGQFIYCRKKFGW